MDGIHKFTPLKEPVSRLHQEHRMIQPKPDPLARTVAFIALFLGVLALIASFGVTPWIYFEASSAKQGLESKADSNLLENMKQEVKKLKETVTGLRIKLAERSRSDNHIEPSVVTVDAANTTGVLNRAKRQAQKDKVADALESSEYGSAVYTRWGRTKCRDGAVTIYSGVAAGGYYGHTGGGSDYQCLPSEPQFDYVNPGVQYATGIGGSAMYGVEFKLNNIDPFDNKFNKGKSMNLQDSTCARCLTVGKSTAMMIPARTNCPPGWTKEYKGYLMAPHYKQKRMTYACVDEAPEPRRAGSNTNGGVYWYPVEISCGAIPCPKYANGHEVSCIVCTR